MITLFLLILAEGVSRCLEGHITGFERNRFLSADVHTFSAVDAFVVAHVFHIHTAVADAAAAAVAFGHVYFHADKTEPVEQSVDRTQRADKAAETAVAEDAGQTYDDQDGKFAREENAEHAVQIGVGRIGEKTDRAFQCAGRADELTETGHRHVVHQAVPERYRDYEDR